MLKFVNDAKLRAGQVLREWKEKREEQKNKAAMNSEHGHGRFFLLHVPATATILAAITEWYWAMLFCIEATGHVDWNYETTAASDAPGTALWNFAFSAHWPVLIGLLCATVPIVMLSMVWLPVQFSMRGTGLWRRGTVIAVGVLANILVIVSGTVVLNYNRQDQVRDALVVEQSADAGRAAIGARLSVAQTELARITAEGNTSNEARAARAGVQGWQTYIREAQSDAGVPAADRQRIVRAMGSAEAADRLRARIEELTVQQATAAPTATTAVSVEDTVGRELNTFAQFVEVWRPPFVAVICTLIGIFGSWWVLALMQGLNPRDVLRSGWADEGHRIEDLRHEAPIASEPMQPQREAVFDGETGEELQQVNYPKFRKKPQKGKRTKVDITPDIPPDETGVNYDGGKRTAVTLGGEMELPARDALGPFQERERAIGSDGSVDAPAPIQSSQEAIEGEVQASAEHAAYDPSADVEQPDLPSDDEAALALQELELTLPDAPVEAPHESEQNDAAAEPDQDSEHVETSEREEPETDPSRMIAAE